MQRRFPGARHVVCVFTCQCVLFLAPLSYAPVWCVRNWSFACNHSMDLFQFRVHCALCETLSASNPRPTINNRTCSTLTNKLPVSSLPSLATLQLAHNCGCHQMDRSRLRSDLGSIKGSITSTDEDPVLSGNTGIRYVCTPAALTGSHYSVHERLHAHDLVVVGLPLIALIACALVACSGCVLWLCALVVCSGCVLWLVVL